jgi:hypothetical protein
LSVAAAGTKQKIKFLSTTDGLDSESVVSIEHEGCLDRSAKCKTRPHNGQDDRPERSHD